MKSMVLPMIGHINYLELKVEDINIQIIFSHSSPCRGGEIHFFNILRKFSTCADAKNRSKSLEGAHYVSMGQVSFTTFLLQCFCFGKYFGKRLVTKFWSIISVENGLLKKYSCFHERGQLFAGIFSKDLLFFCLIKIISFFVPKKYCFFLVFRRKIKFNQNSFQGVFFFRQENSAQRRNFSRNVFRLRRAD